MKINSVFRKKKEESPSGDGSVNIDKMPNENGTVPFRRMMWLWSFILLVSLALTIPAWERVFFPEPPENAFDPSQMTSWLMMGMIVPHFISYVLGALAALVILPQSNWRYMRWLAWQSLGRLIIVFAVMEFVIITFLFLSTMGMDNDSFVVVTESAGMTRVAIFLWNMSIFLMVIPPWVAYRTVWKCYRLLGAQTMQNRYESDLRVMEINNSGQMWDKVTKIIIPRLTGSDGNAPRYVLVFSSVSFFLMAIIHSLGVGLGIQVLYSVALFAISPMMVALSAALAKRRDGSPSIKRPSVLSLVRGPDTEDTYNPAYTGVRQFDRY